MPEGVKGFQKNNKLGRGQPKKLKTQVKDFIKEHPHAVETLMLNLYEMGIKGDREAAIYMVDRFKGKPKATLGIDEEDRDLLSGVMMARLYQQLAEHRKLLKEGQSGQDSEGENEALQGEEA